ncbi:hypothetical protein [Roseovarius sp. MMSF_3281]|uniref:hypothetical protein n=1 Tax=Roseovarius sp. MMSF_3281 TaxID=3046694 RepID=UPI00273D8DD4|nr:hypothetical protein [Roseovarius sp. MMSF_3281]
MVRSHGTRAHFEVEPFRVFAEPELTAAPPWVPGVCFNPCCGARFTPAREWQIYCGAACEALVKAELRRWGHRAALPLLVWRMGKYQTKGPVGDRTRAARRYITHLQSAWWAEWQARGQE